LPVTYVALSMYWKVRVFLPCGWKVTTGFVNCEPGMLRSVVPKSSVLRKSTGARLKPTRTSFCNRGVTVQFHALTKNFVCDSVEASGRSWIASMSVRSSVSRKNVYVPSIRCDGLRE
jgi:hypothetical protein